MNMTHLQLLLLAVCFVLPCVALLASLAWGLGFGAWALGPGFWLYNVPLQDHLYDVPCLCYASKRLLRGPLGSLPMKRLWGRPCKWPVHEKTVLHPPQMLQACMLASNSNPHARARMPMWLDEHPCRHGRLMRAERDFVLIEES